MYATLMMLWATLTDARTKARQQMDNEDGFSTLEWVLIALGVFLAAGAAVAVISNAITSRTSQIS